NRYFALPADMAPHVPAHVSWDEAGCIQPLAIGVQIGKRVDLRAHQTVAIFGCGPIGLIAGAVAHAYSARKIIACDINPSRVEFARKYISPLTGKPIFDHVFGAAPTPAGAGDGEVGEVDDHEETLGDRKWAHAQARAAEFLKEAGLSAEEGVDRVIEASGAEDCGLIGVAIAKQGGTYIGVGLGHLQTSVFPMLAVTCKELDVKGITRYTASCFPSAIDMLSRGVVNVKPLITKTYTLGESLDAFEAVRSGTQIKVVIRNQE
ncbi:hypothetical protein HDZ31DRAFT_51820, partial [Schizophyllum fasciatum]